VCAWHYRCVLPSVKKISAIATLTLPAYPSLQMHLYSHCQSVVMYACMPSRDEDFKCHCRSPQLPKLRSDRPTAACFRPSHRSRRPQDLRAALGVQGSRADRSKRMLSLLRSAEADHIEKRVRESLCPVPLSHTCQEVSGIRPWLTERRSPVRFVKKMEFCDGRFRA
jgi:hypothetical protein